MLGKRGSNDEKGDVSMKKDVSYLTNHYDAKIEKIKKINAPLNFIFYTDPHNGLSEWDCPKHADYAPDDFESALDAVASMQYIIDRLPNLQCVVCGGDLGCDYHDDPQKAHESIEEMMEALYRLTIPVHCCIGNHDDCCTTSALEPLKSFPKFTGEKKPDVSEYVLYPEDLHRICMKNNPTEENYYYTDFEDLGYRFVFLNTSDLCYGTDNKGQKIYPVNEVGVSMKQLQWFKETVQTDKKVIVFSHVPIRAKGHFPDCISETEYLVHGDQLWKAMQQADNVIAAVAGHLHYDNLVYDGKIVSIDTQSGTGVAKGKWDPASPEREFGTITETAFDVISITDKVIYCTRFGVGEDRVARCIRD